jgi:lipoprotein-anchoring transpeptidase ErfK/SrfK
MQWAIQRYRQSEPDQQRLQVTRHSIPVSYSAEALVQKRIVLFPWILLLFFLFCIFLAWSTYPALSASLMSNNNRTMGIVQVLEKATITPSPTMTETATQPPTSTSTEAPTATATETPTLTTFPTETPTELPTDTPEPEPTEAPEPTLGPNGKRDVPAVGKNERWIDVDLSQQRLYAYEGDQIVNSVLVSTGTAFTPTVTGQYRIYVKYRSANMTGNDYFLPDVPYVMYFYKGYGLHGTYWHRNFGTPMSHGCVNLKPKEAKWLFEWASVGTIVYVHR